MKKLLCYAGSIMYSLFTGYLIWLLFFYLTKLTMTFGWTGVILSTVLGGVFLFVEIAFIISLISFPLIYLCGFVIHAKWVSVSVLGLLGLATVALPWTIADYSIIPNIVMASILSICALLIFAAYVSIILGLKDISEEKPNQNYLL